MTNASVLIDMDHIMCAASDPSAARERLTALGFTVTPFSEIQSMGGGNQLMLFHPRTPGLANYVEFISTLDASKIPLPLKPLFLSQEQGGLSIVHGVSDAVAYLDRAAELGMKVLPPMPLARKWRLGEEALEVRFTVGIPLPGQSPLMFNACQHDTLHHFFRPEWTTHGNGIVRVSRALAISAAPAEDVKLLASMHGVSPAPGAYAKIALHGPEIVIEILDAAEAGAFGEKLRPGERARLFGVAFETHSLERTRTAFEAAGCTPKAAGNGFYVVPSEAAGLTMAVTAAL